MSVRIIIILCITLSSVAQTPKAGLYELKWAFFHPFAAVKVKKLTGIGNGIAASINIRQELDSFYSGGKADAFRHVYYMALYAQKIRAQKLVKLGKAHERSNYRQFLRRQSEYGESPDSLSSVMDLRNNDVGIALGCNNPHLDPRSLATLVIKEIRNGKAYILKRDASGRFIKCNGELVTAAESQGKWKVPKCLISSDHQYGT